MDTSYLSDLNWLAILVAAVAYFMVGGIWYSALFKNLWIKHSGVDMNNPNARSGAAGIMVFTVILEIITCIGLAILVHRLQLSGIMSGIKLGLFTGVCFAMVAVVISYLYQMKSTTLKLIDSGYHIVGNIVAAIILCIWQ